MAGFSSLLTGPMAVFIIGGEEPAFWDWQRTEPLGLSVRVSVLIADMDSASAEDVAEADFLLLEQCFEYNYCTEAQPYLDAGKDVLVVEYAQSNPDWDVICAQAKELGMHLLLKDQVVSAGGKACAH